MDLRRLLANVALDLIGQATSVFHYAGKIEGKGRSERWKVPAILETYYPNHLKIML